METKCAHCGCANPPGKVLCVACGKLLSTPPTAPVPIPSRPAAPALARDAAPAGPPVPCPHCGAPNPPGKVWCQQCHKGLLAPPPTAAQQQAQMSAEFRQRLDREGAKSGDVQVSLLWNNYNDLDLHVFCPCGQEIFFRHRRCRCGGELDVDMNVTPTSTSPVENVYWPRGQSPGGRYQVYVHHYRNHKRPGCQDPTHFQVAVMVGGQVWEFQGEIRTRSKPILVHEFELDDPPPGRRRP